jgi:hypothetical protein
VPVMGWVESQLLDPSLKVIFYVGVGQNIVSDACLYTMAILTRSFLFWNFNYGGLGIRRYRRLHREERSEEGQHDASES